MKMTVHLLQLILIHIFVLDIIPLQTQGMQAHQSFKVGLLVSDDQQEHQSEQAIIFKWTIDQINRRTQRSTNNQANNVRLVGLLESFQSGDPFKAEQATCTLLSKGASAIFGPGDSSSSSHVVSICDSLDAPHFNIKPPKYDFLFNVSSSLQDQQEEFMAQDSTILADHVNTRSPSSVDLSVNRRILYRAYIELILNHLKWTDFVYLYDQEDHLFHFEESILQHNKRVSRPESEFKQSVHKLNKNQPYHSLLWTLRTEKRHIAFVDIDCDNVMSFLKQAQQVNMMSEANAYLILCPDLQTFDLWDFQHSYALIIWLSPVQVGATKAKIEKLLHDEQSHHSDREVDLMRHLAAKGISLVSASLHDALMCLANSLIYQSSSDSRSLFSVTSSVTPPFSSQRGAQDAIRCGQQAKQQSQSSDSSTLMNQIRSSMDFLGITGRIKFDSIGGRTEYNLMIMRLSSETGPTIIGNWSQLTGVRFERDELNLMKRAGKNLFELKQGKKPRLIVVSIKNEPYFMNRPSTKLVSGNDRYEGYAVDLIAELAQLVNFDYEFKEVDDGKHGVFNNKTGQWNGIIGELIKGKADLAIADLSITSAREDAVDFTLPFMNTGISILLKKPTTKELEFFSFLSPFESHVWSYVVGAYLGVSTLLFVVSRISPYEWNDPHPCRREDKILRNQFTMSNSLWFTIAAVMQQGSDLAPRSLSTRLVAAIWYFFTLIMINSYTANLAAFLTVERVVYPIERAEDLYRHPAGLRYGCLQSGSTRTFFEQSREDSTFRKMFHSMELVKTNEQGKAMVERGNYAFFMESTSIEYTVERNCNLTQIGGLLDSKGYGIALQKNSNLSLEYRAKLSEAILSLQESGVLHILKNRWWREKRGGGACDHDDGQAESVKELTLANVGGVFAIVLVGITMGFLLCAIELYYKSHRLASQQNTSKWVQLKRRIKFALDLNDNY